MSNWKKYKLKDLGTLGRGKSKHRPRDAAHLYGGPYPFIQTGDVKNANHKIYSFTQTYSEDGLKQSKLWDKETICITIAANIADTGILTFPACFPDSVLGFVADKSKCNVEFMEYMLQHYQKAVQKHSIGSVQENINLGTFENLEFPIPDLTTQTRIASILSALDDKIELNRQTNQTLEQIAQTLFKKYFVDDIDPDNLPEGWRWERIGDYISSISKTHKFPKEEIIFLNTSDILEGKVLHNNYSEIHSLPGQAKKSIQKDDILLSEIRPANKRFAYINFEAADYVVSTKLMVLRSISNIHPLFFYFIITRDEMLGKLQNLAESRSGTFPQITFEQLKNIEFILPDENTLNNFINKTLIPSFEMIFKNEKETEYLIKLRDSLLPKLMSGEIEV